MKPNEEVETNVLLVLVRLFFYLCGGFMKDYNDQGQRFLEALEEHLKTITPEELYRRLKKRSPENGKGQTLQDFLEGVDDYE